MIAIFEENKFITVMENGCSLLLPYQIDNKYALYDTNFSGNPDLYDFVLDINNNVCWFHKAETEISFTFAQRLKILFTGKYSWTC